MKKKARFYLGFFICSGERVKTVFTCSRVFLSLICTNARTRINTGFFVHSLISISQAVRGRTGQVTNAALGRRGLLRAANWKARAWVRDRTGRVANVALGRRSLLRAANWKARAQVGWRQVKVLPAFSKGRYVPVGRCPAADRAGRRDQTPRPYRGAGGPGARWAPFRTDRGGSRDRSPCLPLLPKKGGTDVPLLGVAQSPGVLLEEGAGRVPQRPLPGLSAAQRAPRSLHFSTGCAGLRSRPRDAVSRSASL